jgi:hypothetical protein
MYWPLAATSAVIQNMGQCFRYDKMYVPVSVANKDFTSKAKAKAKAKDWHIKDKDKALTVKDKDLPRTSPVCRQGRLMSTLFEWLL